MRGDFPHTRLIYAQDCKTAGGYRRLARAACELFAGYDVVVSQLFREQVMATPNTLDGRIARAIFKGMNEQQTAALEDLVALGKALKHVSSQVSAEDYQLLTQHIFDALSDQLKVKHATALLSAGDIQGVRHLYGI
jgi:hemoglobin-like flavoprotein